MEFFKYQFNEDEWVIYLLDEDDTVLTDEDIEAEVKFAEKEIYFRPDGINLKTILHELWHVYFGYCYLGATNDITLSDMEEITSELFADKAQRIIKRAEDIQQRLEKLRDKKE